MRDSEAAAALGLWGDADLEGTAGSYSGDGADDDIERVRRFSRHVCQLALQRWTQHRTAMRRDAIAIFLLRPAAPEAVSTVREPMLGDGGVEVCGKIWFVNVTAQSGRGLAVEPETDGRMFEMVEQLALGHVPAVVFNPTVAAPVARIYARGLREETEFVRVTIAEREVNVTSIRQTIDTMYEKQLATPDMQVDGASMWVNARKCWAASNAEAIAQLQVKTALAVQFFDCDIRQEQRTRAGRSDLEIVQRRTDGAMVTPAELEIKVLRERNRRGKKWSDAFIEKWMRRGVRQAAAYRDLRDAGCGMLCCFDMRERDRGQATTFEAIRSYAKELNVSLHRNHLYHSAEAWRIARYGC